MSAPDVFGRSIADDEYHISFVESLRFAVPFFIYELRGREPAWLIGEVKRSAWAVGERGAALMFTERGERSTSERNSAALAFEGLARGLATIAIVEGQVTYAGLHWCTAQHEDCPASSIRPGEKVTAAEIDEAVAMLDEFAALVGAARGRRSTSSGPTGGPLDAPEADGEGAGPANSSRPSPPTTSR